MTLYALKTAVIDRFTPEILTFKELRKRVFNLLFQAKSPILHFETQTIKCIFLLLEQISNIKFNN